VVLAALPTITEVSRGAFFASKPIKQCSRLSSEEDTKRWAGNSEVVPYVPETETPRVLLRSEGHTTFGSASREALTLVGDERHRIVAVVINAIDASLRGDTQERHRWTADTIKSLSELLDKAREAGRVVLLASDHGHVPADRLQSVKAIPNAGSRWRPWTDEDHEPADYEVTVNHETAWHPRGAKGLVLAADDAHIYGGKAVAGVHGGATLAEVVAPCLLIGCDDLAHGTEDDRDLAARPALVPNWWHFDTTPGPRPSSEAPAPIRKPRTKPPKVDERQLELRPVDQAPPQPAQQQAPAPNTTAFEKSAVLKAKATKADLRRQVVQAVGYLQDHNGVASASAFASAMGVIPYRIAGFISRLQEVLNVDGYPVLRYERDAGQVYLDTAKLREQFEVEE
jgi:hypothetical protein